MLSADARDVDARPIRKGRLGKPVEFGYKAQVIDNADGVILDHRVEMGNPTDGPQLAPAIARITRRVGRAPRSSLPTAVMGRPPSRPACTSSGFAVWRYPAQASRVRPVANSNTEKRSGRNSNGGRIRRTDQPSETQLRLEPHRNHRHHRGPNLVRTRRLRPQSRQDQRPRRLIRAGQSSRTRQLTRSRRSSHRSNPFSGRSS
jgi:hypothetical protein